MRVPGGGASCLGVGRPGTGALPTPTTRPFGRAAGAQYPLAVGAGGAGVGTRHQPHIARFCELALRAVGAARGRPRGGVSCLGVGHLGTGALPPRTTRPFGRAAGARFPLAVGPVCGRGGPAVFATSSLAAVRRVLCALPGFAAPGGRCGLAPVPVPWLWQGACLSVVPRGPAWVRRSSSGPVALSAPVGFPVTVVPSPTPGAVAPGFTAWLRGARGGRPRTGYIVPAAGPCRLGMCAWFDALAPSLVFLTYLLAFPLNPHGPWLPHTFCAFFFVVYLAVLGAYGGTMGIHGCGLCLCACFLTCLVVHRSFLRAALSPWRPPSQHTWFPHLRMCSGGNVGCMGSQHTCLSYHTFVFPWSVVVGGWWCFVLSLFLNWCLSFCFVALFFFFDAH